MNKREYIRSVDRLCEEYGVSHSDTTGSSNNNIRDFVINAYDLIGTRVSVHTNRNAHIWSILGPNGKSPVRAYAFDCVFLKDVCWLPPTVGNARRTFRKLKSEGKQERTVQAFAEGVLVAVDDMPFGDFSYDERIRLRYNPMAEEWVGAFRDRDSRRPIASSEYASLQYTQSLSNFHLEAVRAGSRPSETYAYDDVEWIPSEYDAQYVRSIVTDNESEVQNLKKYISPSCKRYKSR